MEKREEFFLILIPITKEEQYNIVENLGDDNLYILYKREEKEEIEIGMLSSIMREYYPHLANTYHLDEIREEAYFYGGGVELLEKALQIKDRPVYKITPTLDRKVKYQEVLNEQENIDIEEIMKGKRFTYKDKIFSKKI